MATDQRNILVFVNNDAEFRQWGSAVASALQSVGLTKASDTGQIDWATVARPSVANTVAGYEIYRFSDSLQATKPVFIKLEYGSGSAITQVSCWITIGSSTNGAGTINSAALTTRRQIAPSTTTTGQSFPAYSSGSSDRIAFFLTNSGSTSYMGFSIERSKTAAGVTTGDIVQFQGMQTNTNWWNSTLQIGVTVKEVSTSACPALALSQGFSAVGSNITFSPHFIPFGIWLYTWNLSYLTTDLTGLVPFTFSHLGGNHTFMPLGMSAAYAVQASLGTHGMAILWE